MRKVALMIGILFVFSYIKASEFDFDGKNIEKVSVGSMLEKTSVPEPVIENKARPDKEWTFMVFVNGKNNLEQFAIKDINEMEMVGSSDKVNIVVEVGRIKGYDSSNGDWKTTRRYYVTKDNDTNIINSKMIADLGKVDMGDYKSVIDFVKWAKANYPAKKYMLVIWNHGAGWEKSLKANITKGISYDDETGNHITTPQLGLIFKEAGKIDVYGSDACLMQMAEVVYEIKDSITYIVGSEETEPGDGYTYNDLLAPLIANPTMGPAELAKTAVDAYSDHYKAQGEGSTQSYVRTSAIPDFLNAVNEFIYAVSQSGDKALVKNAISQAQEYAISENKDLYHFTSIIVNGTKDAAVKEKGQALMTLIKNKLVAHNRYTNGSGGWYGPTDYSNSNGISVYLPTSGIGSGYDELQWAKYSNWDEFIKWYQAQ